MRLNILRESSDFRVYQNLYFTYTLRHLYSERWLSLLNTLGDDILKLPRRGRGICLRGIYEQRRPSSDYKTPYIRTAQSHITLRIHYTENRFKHRMQTLLRRQFACNVKPYFLQTTKRNIESKCLKTNLWTCAPSENYHQPAQSLTLIRIFTGRSSDCQGCKVSSSGQRTLTRMCGYAGWFGSP